MLPYVVTIVAVSGLVGRVRPPKADGSPTSMAVRPPAVATCSRNRAGSVRPMAPESPPRPELAIDWAALRAAADKAATHAYAPYSGLHVGAAGIADDGRIVVGCNVENASYGLTLCAECGLVSALVGSGGGRSSRSASPPATVARSRRADGAASSCSSTAARAWPSTTAGCASAHDRRPAPGRVQPRRPDRLGGRSRDHRGSIGRRAGAHRIDMVDVIRSKRDGHELSDDEIDWVIDAYVDGDVADEQVAALLMAIFWRGLSVAELSQVDERDHRLGRADGPLGPVAPDRRQALDRRRRRQGVAHPRAARGGLRRRGPAAVGARARPHGRHARQAGGDPGMALRALQRRDPRPARGGRAASSARPAPDSRRPTASSTRCAT